MDDSRNGRPEPSGGSASDETKGGDAAPSPTGGEPRRAEARSRAAHHEEPDPRFIREPDE